MTRVYVDIVGDLFHIGHINLFKKARALFEKPYLIVGVHSDRDVESYKRTPVICQEQRYEMIRCCRLVDKVIESAPLVITKDYIEQNKIDYVVHGDDFSESLKIQHEVPISMKIVKYVEYTKDISTSKIINKIHSSKTC
jgi:cytidyltransferase-like protein|tara:strand:+ start:16 stop:432 length:417 start_codon:yes stop_codon:yes gene_type:complete